VVLLSALAPATPAGGEPGDLALIEVASGLAQPLTVRHAGDGSGRLFVVERLGRIRIVDPNAGVLATPFLDLTAVVDAVGGEQGLLGLDFHPDYESNGFFYVNYTWDPPGENLDRTVVARYSVSAGDPDVANPASGVTLLELEQNAGNHNGGNILFGPDGYLYVGLGDGGGARDPGNEAQDPTTLLGSMLRIDVNGTPPGPPNDLCGLVASYGIPLDNPFATADGDCDEIWVIGLRNPWRWSFDRLTGDLWLGDVGQGPDNPREEIDFQPAASAGGENYGWSCKEGFAMPNYNDCLPGLLTDPILDYDHSSGRCSVTGGYRYRGHRITDFRGTYLFGDFCSGEVWLVVSDGAGGWEIPAAPWADTATNVLSFGEDEDGELYLAGSDGRIYRFESPSSIFVDDFEAGDMAAWSSAIGSL
jgi:glucose/arabinose dehydrogenase